MHKCHLSLWVFCTGILAFNILTQYLWALTYNNSVKINPLFVEKNIKLKKTNYCHRKKLSFWLVCVIWFIICSQKHFDTSTYDGSCIVIGRTNCWQNSQKPFFGLFSYQNSQQMAKWPLVKVGRVGIFNLISIFHFLLTGHGAGKKEKRRQEGFKKGRGDLKRACPLKPILFIICYVLKNFVQVNFR